MKTNKKLIALICAISMIFSMFAAFSFTASAEGNAKSIVLEYDSKASTKTKAVVNVKTTGFEKVGSYAINLNAPAGATDAKATFELLGEGTVNFVDGVYYNGNAVVNAKDVPANSIIMTVEFTLPEAGLAEDSVVSLAAGATIADDDVELVFDIGTLSQSEVAIPTDPKATPAPPAVQKPTQLPDDEPVIEKPEVPVEKGLKLVRNSKSTATKAIIDVVAVDFTKIGSYAINVTAPEGTTEAKATFELLGEGTVNFVDGVYYNGNAVVNAKDVPADGVIMTIEFTGTFAEKAFAELATGATVADDDVELVLDIGTLPKAWTYISATKEPVVKKSFELKNMVSAEKAQAAIAKNENVYVTVAVDPASAVYGTDYVAYLNNEKLGPNAFSNLISGYDSTKTMVDVINGVKFEIYDTNVVKSITAVLNNESTNKQIESTTESVTPSKPVTDKTPTISAEGNTTVEVGKSSSVTVKVNNPGDYGVLTAKVKSINSLDAVTGSGIYVKETVKGDDGKDVEQITKIETEDVEIPVTKEGTKIQFTAAAKGKIELVFNYTCTGTATGSELKAKEVVKTINVKEKEVVGGGSDSKPSTGTGIIAGPADSYAPNYNATSKFTDLDSVPWAQTAINSLAAINVISGRDDTTFDPNANVTRAEYCRILVGTMGKQNETADVAFDDVASDAWYYQAVAVASKYGIVSGYGDGNFGPNDLITRQDMAVMTEKAAAAMNKSFTAVTAAEFTDADQIAGYASDAVFTLANAGVINGMGDGTFAPVANATRAQAAVIIYTAFTK